MAESLDPATTASAVARRYGLHASQLVAWRQQLQRRASAATEVSGPASIQGKGRLDPQRARVHAELEAKIATLCGTPS